MGRTFAGVIFEGRKVSTSPRLQWENLRYSVAAVTRTLTLSPVWLTHRLLGGGTCASRARPLGVNLERLYIYPLPYYTFPQFPVSRPHSTERSSSPRTFTSWGPHRHQSKGSASLLSRCWAVPASISGVFRAGYGECRDRRRLSAACQSTHIPAGSIPGHGRYRASDRTRE